MKPQHIDPAEAVQIHRDVRSMRSVACHHATFWCGAAQRAAEPGAGRRVAGGGRPTVLFPLLEVPPWLPTLTPSLQPLPPLCSLTDEPMDEPAKRLPKEAAAAQLPPDAFVSLRHGATIVAAGGATLNAPALLPVVA
jgi:hypothetical protein